MNKSGNISNAQLKKVWTLIRQQHLGEIKESLVMQFTNSRTTHVREMTVTEVSHLITALVKDDPDTRMRNKVIAICHGMGWLMPGMHELNRLIIDRFLEKRGVVKKPLSKLRGGELVKVVSQFEQMQKKEELRKFGKTVVDELLLELNIDKETGKPR
jgi:hypothetical protein